MNSCCFALDLNDDPRLIAEYRRWHQHFFQLALIF